VAGSGSCPEFGADELRRADLRPSVAERRISGRLDLYNDGKPSAEGYEMPARDPWDIWADVTGAPCPRCDQTLVWYEAGYAPGYRVCMATTAGGDAYDPATLRHRWLWWDGILVVAR
jgi:hypothetical protein